MKKKKALALALAAIVAHGTAQAEESTSTNTATITTSGTTLTVSCSGNVAEATVSDGKKLADHLAEAVGTTYTTVVFKSADGKDKATIDNTITRALVKIATITTLNLRDVCLEALNPRKQGESAEDPTFSVNTLGTWGTNTNTTLTTLYTPCVKGGTLAQGVFNDLTALKHLYLSAGITTLGENCFYVTTSTNKFALETIGLPNTLKTIGAGAFKDQKAIEAFTLPASLDSIGKEAFSGTDPKDVYFLGVDAPKVDKDAWSDANYINNNSITWEAQDGESGTTVTVNMANGTACHANYHTSNGWMTMMHYPSACTKAQAARYTDITREYKKIDYDANNLTTCDNRQATCYTPGKETEELKGTTDQTGFAAAKSFYNADASGKYSNGNYTGGFDDAYVGSQYRWPSWGMFIRATVVAQHGLLWDGVTTIAAGIKQHDGSYTGNGEEYIGLHRFALAKADANADAKEGWPMAKYADGKWHTVCLPFSLTKGQMAGIFGSSDIRLCKFSFVKRYKGLDDQPDQLLLSFNDEQFTDDKADNDTVLKAHVPYMIKASRGEGLEDADIVATDYEMEQGDAMPTNVSVETEPGISVLSDDDEATKEEGAQYYFIGNYLSGIKMPQYSYFFSKSKGKFSFQVGTTGNWNAYTAIVQATSGEDDKNDYFGEGGEVSQGKFVTLLGEDSDGGIATGTRGVTIVAGGELVRTDAKVYDLQGRLASSGGTQGLAKGVYVVGGKKVAIK